MKNEAFTTFSKRQKERAIITDEELRKELDSIEGLSYVLVKGFQFIVTDPEKFKTKEDSEITRRIKQLGNKSGIILL